MGVEPPEMGVEPPILLAALRKDWRLDLRLDRLRY
jgi:hypothetical protein